MRHRSKAISIFVFVCFIAFFVWSNNFYLSAVPKEFDVHKIVYREENAWGFGPGGNETGVRVYELPEKTYIKIKKQGMGYFNDLPSNAYHGRDWRGHYADWSETPIKVTMYWANYMSLPDKADYSKETPSITHYLNAYGFGINIRADIKRMIDNAITEPGSYYAYGRIGVIIVIPKLRRVIYAYNG